MQKEGRWKKIGIIIFCLISVFFAFLYIQKEKAKDQLTQILQRQDIELSDFGFSFLPQPTFTAKQVRYPLDKQKSQSVFFEKIELRLSGLSALFGQLKFKHLYFDNGSVWLTQSEVPDFHAIHLRLKPTALYTADLQALSKSVKNNDWSRWDAKELTDKGHSSVVFSAQNAQNDQITLEGDINLTLTGVLLNSVQFAIELAQPTYGNNKNFKFAIGNGYIGKSFSRNIDYEISSDMLRINDEDLGRTRAEIHMPNESRDGYFVVITSAVCGGCTTLFEFEQNNKQNRKMIFRTEYFPLEKLLGVFKLPVLMTGESNVYAEVQFEQKLPTQGKFELNVSSGTIKGLNLLSLAAQYLPLRFNEGGLEDQSLETKFEQFSSRFSWQEQGIKITDLYLRTPDLLARGQGEVDLQNMQCDVALNVGLNDEKYKKYDLLTLPIRFFDSCYS
ncbi:MAG TPA: hypothetical protein DD638_03780, partial [Pasteurellaceae bacterium]|nr:hypothetical protein [Pasteurellaceae bacterium]